MSTYVCNFDVVDEQANKIITSASEMSSALNKYVSSTKEHLSGWGGTSAKKAFDLTNDEQVSVTNTSIKEIDEVGNFVKNAAKAIANLEEQLGGMNI